MEMTGNLTKSLFLRGRVNLPSSCIGGSMSILKKPTPKLRENITPVVTSTAAATGTAAQLPHFGILTWPQQPVRHFLVRQYFPTPLMIQEMLKGTKSGMNKPPPPSKSANSIPVEKVEAVSPGIGRIPCKYGTESAALVDDDVPDPPPEAKIVHESTEDDYNYELNVYLGRGFHPENVHVSLDHGVVSIEAESDEKFGSCSVHQEIHEEFPLPNNVTLWSHNDSRAFLDTEGNLKVQVPLPQSPDSPETEKLYTHTHFGYSSNDIYL